MTIKYLCPTSISNKILQTREKKQICGQCHTTQYWWRVHFSEFKYMLTVSARWIVLVCVSDKLKYQYPYIRNLLLVIICRPKRMVVPSWKVDGLSSSGMWASTFHFLLFVSTWIILGNLHSWHSRVCCQLYQRPIHSRSLQKLQMWPSWLFLQISEAVSDKSFPAAGSCHVGPWLSPGGLFFVLRQFHMLTVKHSSAFLQLLSPRVLHLRAVGWREAAITECPVLALDTRSSFNLYSNKPSKPKDA